MNKKYVTFEQAEWLKEKGFNEICYSWYTKDTIASSLSMISNSKLEVNQYSRPEQHEVVDWLRINHDIHVCPLFNAYSKKYLVNIDKVETKFQWQLELFDTPQEAYNAAFDYIKNNKIIK